MTHRTFAGAVATTAAATLALSLMTSPTVAAAPTGTARADTLTNVYNNPIRNYLRGADCLIRLRSIPDFTLVPSITQCGLTITFTVAPEKRSVPVSWPLWGKAPTQVELSNPDVLFTNGRGALRIDFSSPRRVAGVEASPRIGIYQTLNADYLDASGNLIGTISRTIKGGKARLLGAKTDASTKVSTIHIHTTGDFAIGRIRFNR